MAHDTQDLPEAGPGKILLVDDDPLVLGTLQRVLEAEGFAVVTAADGREAMAKIAAGRYEVIVSDITMPGMDGLELLRSVRERDLDVPVVLMTGFPTLETAAKAVEYGALRYLFKPVPMPEFRQTIHQASRLSRLARLKRMALEHLGGAVTSGDRAGLEARFERGLAAVYVVYQPIVWWSRREVYGHEALLRSNEPTFPGAQELLAAAERLGRVEQLGRVIRSRIAADLEAGPAARYVFVNLHSRDLLDDELYSASAPLSRFAGRVVLEITERASLDHVPGVPARIDALRAMGYCIAVDDLGAGYAGLNTFALLAPEVVKVDMSLVRNLHAEPVKQKLIRSMVQLCREMDLLVVAEGVETTEERDALVEQGCDLLQGYLFAPPGRPYPPVRW